MKKILILFFVLFTTSIFSQEEKNILNSISSKRHEFRFDPLKAIIHRRIGISYEYFLNKRFSVGISGTFLTDPFKLDKYRNFEKASTPLFYGVDINFVNKYHIIPNVRYNFAKTENSNFYVEFFTSINGGIQKSVGRIIYQNTAFYDVVDFNYVNIGLGGSLGCKIYTKRGFCMDIFAGLGGNLSLDNGPTTLSRFGINFGYRL